MKENIGLKGKLKIEHVSNGLVNTFNYPNTVVTAGKSMIAGLMTADIDAGSAFDWMGIGLGSNTVAAADVVLGSEYLKIGPGSVTGTQETTTVTDDTMRLIGSFGIEDTKVINEAGIFNQSGLDIGSMLSRTGFADISAISGDWINVQWDVAVA